MTLLREPKKRTIGVREMKLLDLHYMDKETWAEAKAQARLQGMTIGQWLQEAIKAHILAEVALRSKLPETAQCERCHITIHAKKSPRRIVHHDSPGNREASVVKLLCPKCHRERHKELGWGYSGRPARSKCAWCHEYRSAFAPAEVVFHDPKTHRRVQVCNFCWVKDTLAIADAGYFKDELYDFKFSGSEVSVTKRRL